MGPEELSFTTLSRITLLQSMVMLIPEPDKIIDSVTHELRGLPGIEVVEYKATDVECCQREHRDSAEVHCCEIRYKQHQFGCFHIGFSSSVESLQYLPFLKNMMNMLGVIFAEKKQRHLNEQLTEELEQRVEERTRELRENEEKYRRLIEGLGPRHCVFSHTVEGKFIFASSGFGTLFGIPANAIIGKDWRTIPMTPSSLAIGNEADRKIIEEQTYQRIERTVLHPNNVQRTIEVYYGPVFENGTVTKLEGICTDITDQKKSERLLQRTQKLESLGTLAGGIAHDFNNLLGGIYGYMDLAAELSTDTEAGTYLVKSLDTIERARSLTNQLLTFAKGGQPNKSRASLSPLLPDAVRFALSGSNVLCSFSLPDNLWVCEIDKNQIVQVIDNLIINAKQAMPGGGRIEIGAVNLTIDEENNDNHLAGRYVKITITDHGAGISESQLPFIFDPFYSTKTTGHGLGLAMSHSIVTRHGGYLEVQSQEGKGTTFSILLPATGGLVEEADTGEPTSRHEGCGYVVIMDDEDVILDTTTHYLETLGYGVICTRNGNEVISFLDENRQDLPDCSAMIFDLTIKGAMGGKETVRKVREYMPELPIFVASGYADDPVMASPGAYGFTASIRKPFRMAELGAMLRRHTGHPPPRGGVSGTNAEAL